MFNHLKKKAIPLLFLHIELHLFHFHFQIFSPPPNVWVMKLDSILYHKVYKQQTLVGTKHGYVKQYCSNVSGETEWTVKDVLIFPLNKSPNGHTATGSFAFHQFNLKPLGEWNTMIPFFVFFCFFPLNDIFGLLIWFWPAFNRLSSLPFSLPWPQPLWLESQIAPIKVSSQRDSQSVGHNHHGLRWKASNWLTGSLSRLRMKASRVAWD